MTRQTERQTDRQTSRLIDWISLEANSVKIRSYKFWIWNSKQYCPVVWSANWKLLHTFVIPLHKFGIKMLQKSWKWCMIWKKSYKSLFDLDQTLPHHVPWCCLTTVTPPWHCVTPLTSWVERGTVCAFHPPRIAPAIHSMWWAWPKRHSYHGCATINTSMTASVPHL